MAPGLIRLAALALLAACGSAAPDGHPEGARGTPLTAAEVRETFIGKPWRGASGIYSFDADGTYTYRSEKTTRTWGPWRYTVEQDGTVAGSNARFRFYRIGTAYRYHNSASGEFYLARPGIAD